MTHYVASWAFTDEENDVYLFTKRYDHEPTKNAVRHDGYLWYFKDDFSTPSFGVWMDNLCQVGWVDIAEEEPITVVVNKFNGSIDGVGVLSEDIGRVRVVVVSHDEHADPDDQHLWWTERLSALEDWHIDAPTDALRVCADQLPESVRDKLGV